MKIKLLTSCAGAGFAWSVGDEIEVSDAEAARMIEVGQALPVREAEVEKAARKQRAEKATKR